ncbi:MAG: excinuclease ABC subunit UvrA, partial [bacterium]
SINRGGIVPIGELKENQTFTQLRAMAKHYKFSMADPIASLPQETIDLILHGTEETFSVDHVNSSGKKVKYQTNFKGIIKFVQEQYFESSDDNMRAWAEEFMHTIACPEC